ncbi:formate dehydrogenase accessory sulfurtransferase FdhD [Thioclava sp. JE_KL1]|uniref:formate dehydrogenase accessory sulfurtransferase FdhD n=1 Tax=Thioclava sp. JE_KL1 TaxID=2651187 RepID=UPI00128C66F2|nr:formate dehydrogenase accessory sulfurtransferase FdhD [Thioclava sp. JE_KL1]MPQ92786.1 formate dehydrogenase accessory sulfurtransferase FdhD [Thioclava sp. JE_KL1]
MTATDWEMPSGAVQRLAEEVPVALSFDGVTQAVMMASPADLEDFALGFALSEGLIADASEITRQELEVTEAGIEARNWLAAPAGARFAERRRATMGPVGCGLCGIEQLEEARRKLSPVRPPRFTMTPEQATEALETLRDHQPLQDETRAAHASSFWQPGKGIVLTREDVGRHNALDKLIGALIRGGIDPASGALVMTSRLSVDLIQKVVMLRISVIVGPSAPTALAVSEARDAGLTVIARAGRGLALYTAPQEATA